MSAIEKRVIKVLGVPSHERGAITAKLLVEPSATPNPIHWPEVPATPHIRRAARRSIPKRPDIFKPATKTAPQNEAVPVTPPPFEDFSLAPPSTPPITAFETPVVPPPPVTEALTAFSDATQMLDFEKNLQELNKTVAALPRFFDVPPIPMVSVAGHSIRGLRTIAFPSALPGFTDEAIEESLLARAIAILPVAAFILLCGALGWTTLHFGDRTPAHSRSGRETHEITDRLKQHAMAPAHSAYDGSDDAALIKAHAAEVHAYNRPDPKSPVVASLSTQHTYPLLQKNGNWIKFALDKNHSAWVDEAGVELVR